LQKGSRGCSIFVHQNHAAGGGTSSIMVGMFVCLCLASRQPSEWESFVPARTDLGVKLFILTIIWLLATVVCKQIIDDNKKCRQIAGDFGCVIGHGILAGKYLAEYRDCERDV
jgi:hypothetical protein